MAAADRRRGRSALIFAAVLGVLSLVAAWALTVSPLFRLEDLTVDGLDHLKQAQVLHLAQISDSTNVLWLSAGKVEGRIESDPWVADAEITKDLPSGLTIRVRERSPVAVAGAKRAWLLVSPDGVVVDTARARPTLPELPGVAGLTVGQTIPEGHMAAARLAGSLNSYGVSEAVESVVVDPTGDLRLVLVEGGKVTVGPPEELDQKAEAIAGIVKWAEVNDSDIRSIDVTAPAAPAAKVSRGTPPVEG